MKLDICPLLSKTENHLNIGPESIVLSEVRQGVGVYTAAVTVFC